MRRSVKGPSADGGGWGKFMEGSEKSRRKESMLPASPFPRRLTRGRRTGGVLRTMRMGAAVSPGKLPDTPRRLHVSPQYPDRKTLLP